MLRARSALRQAPVNISARVFFPAAEEDDGLGLGAS
jgi:hypothetical protein